MYIVGFTFNFTQLIHHNFFYFNFLSACIFSRTQRLVNVQYVAYVFAVQFVFESRNKSKDTKIICYGSNYNFPKNARFTCILT